MNCGDFREIIVLDLETNTASSGDVLEAAAIKASWLDGSFVEISRFHRFYLSPHPSNYYALQVHGLSHTKLLHLRGDCSYPEYFLEDKAFSDFCAGSDVLIAHNIGFETRHTLPLVSFPHRFCTMSSNRNFVCAVSDKGRVKPPTLKETCMFYKIPFDDDQYHGAIYDSLQTLKILNEMIKAGRISSFS